MPAACCRVLAGCGPAAGPARVCCVVAMENGGGGAHLPVSGAPALQRSHVPCAAQSQPPVVSRDPAAVAGVPKPATAYATGSLPTTDGGGSGVGGHCGSNRAAPVATSHDGAAASPAVRHGSASECAGNVATAPATTTPGVTGAGATAAPAAVPVAAPQPAAGSSEQGRRAVPSPPRVDRQRASDLAVKAPPASDAAAAAAARAVSPIVTGGPPLPPLCQELMFLATAWLGADPRTQPAAQVLRQQAVSGAALGVATV